MTISVHDEAARPYAPLFKDSEAVFRAYGGRPHWGKIQSAAAAGSMQDQAADLTRAVSAFKLPGSVAVAMERGAGGRALAMTGAVALRA